MIFPQRDNKRKRRKTALTLSIFGVCIVIITVLNTWAPTLLSPLVQTIAEPLFSSKHSLGRTLQNMSGVLHSKVSLLETNRRLRRDMATLDAVKAERDLYKSEYEKIQAILGRIESPQTIVLANILSKPGSSPYDTVIVDVGAEEGLKTGDLVMAPDMVTLGKVSEVYARSAIITFYSSSEQHIQVLVGPQAIESTATGKGGGNFELKLPRNVELKEGDQVVAAEFPGKPFGVIYGIEVKPTDSFEQVLFRNPTNISQLQYLLIEKRS